MKKVVLCVTGSVAGIKAADLVSKLQKSYDVKVVTTSHGRVFLEKPGTGWPLPHCATDADDYKVKEYASGCHRVYDVAAGESACSHVFLLCQHQCGHTTILRLQEGQDDPLHIQLADWADVLVFAPLSANSLAKLSLGLADNVATRLFRAWNIAEKPALVAPAMNTKMWIHPATSSSLDTIRSWGVVVIEPVAKMLACGDVGVGAMACVDDITAAVLTTFFQP